MAIAIGNHDIGQRNRIANDSTDRQHRDADTARQPGGGRALGWARWGTIGVSIGLYALACATPALHFATVPPRPSNATEIWPGWAVVASGMLAVVALQFAWYANLLLPFVYLSLALRRWRIATALALLTTLVAANLAFLPFQKIPYSEGPEFFHIVLQRPLIGSFLWVASILVTLVGAIAGLILARRTRRGA